MRKHTLLVLEMPRMKALVSRDTGTMGEAMRLPYSRKISIGIGIGQRGWKGIIRRHGCFSCG